VYLRLLTLDDVSDAYVAWMNDPWTNRFMETRWRAHAREDVAAFVDEKLASPVEHLFGIFVAADDRHVGNLKVGPVDERHRRADVSYFLGDAAARGRGLAADAVAQGVRFAFEGLGLEKLSAGVYAENAASARVLEKCGFVREGVRREHVVFEGRRSDTYEYGLTRADWAAAQARSA
jgi:RimJ/RimL family protein N-acetyltransferase